MRWIVITPGTEARLPECARHAQFWHAAAAALLPRAAAGDAAAAPLEPLSGGWFGVAEAIADAAHGDDGARAVLGELEPQPAGVRVQGAGAPGA